MIIIRKINGFIVVRAKKKYPNLAFVYLMQSKSNYMKNFLTLFLVVLAFGAITSLHGQTSLKVGLGGHTSVINVNSMDFTTSNGFGASFGAGAQFGRRLFFETGLQVLSSNQSIEPVRSIANPQTVSLDAKLLGVHVPVLVGFHVKGQDADLNFHFLAGGNVRTVAAARAGSDYQTRDFRFANVGGMVGAGVTTGIFFGELAYDFGVTDIFKSELGEEESRQNFIRLTVGLHLFRN